MTEGGALDRIYKINKIFRISDEGYRSALAFALRMGRAKKSPPCKSELSQVRFFIRPYPDTSGVTEPIGESEGKNGREFREGGLFLRTS